MRQTRQFQRRKEDFLCQHCGKNVKGSGYTDHCPVCLWSQHVDINPGDRQNKCCGLMEPQEIELGHGEYFIHYRCQKCGFCHRVRAAAGDSPEEIMKLVKN
jgi:rubrerythrin